MAKKAVALAVLGVLLAVFCFPARSMGGGADGGRMQWNVLDTTKPDDLVSPQVTVAELVITLVRAGDKDPAQVFGIITATVSRPPIKIELFKNSEDNSIPVGFGSPIPLKVPGVYGVPLNSDLRIDAFLVTLDPSGADEVIAVGYATFHAKRFGSEIKTIDGDNGQIEVEVTWPDFYSKNTGDE